MKTTVRAGGGTDRAIPATVKPLFELLGNRSSNASDGKNAVRAGGEPIEQYRRRENHCSSRWETDRAMPATGKTLFEQVGNRSSNASDGKNAVRAGGITDTKTGLIKLIQLIFSQNPKKFNFQFQRQISKLQK